MQHDSNVASYHYQSYEDDSVHLTPESPSFYDHVSRYWWAASFARGKNVLDCACGKGYGTYILSKEAKSALGVDLNKNSLTIARETFTRPNLEYLEQDILRLKESGKTFDLITAFEVIEHIPPETTDSFLRSIAGILAPNGIALISTPNHDVVMKSGVIVPDFHINNFKASELKTVLSRHFNAVKMNGQFKKRAGLGGVIFDFDFFNLRHVAGKLLRSTRATTESDNAQNKSGKIDVSLFESRSAEVENYEFSPRHWRQAGLTVAICSKPR